MKPISVLRITLSLTIAIAAHSASASTVYEVIQIGNLAGYDDGLPMAINNRNFVVGNSFSGEINRPWLYSESAGIQPIGPGFGQEFYMRDLNFGNQAAGYAEGWQHGVRASLMQIIGWGNLPGYAKTEAWGINDSGAMVGWATTEGNLQRAIRLNTNFTYSLLPTLDPTADSQARRTNNAGVAVGHSNDRAVLWTANNAIVDLHSMMPNGAIKSFASDINDAGWVTGYYLDAQNHSQGFRFNFESGMTFFDPLEGDAWAVSRAMNIHGHTVGVSRRTESVGALEAFVNTGTATLSLNSLIAPNSGWILREATDINDNGYIVGRGTYQGVSTNFLLKPVPEPASVIALAMGIAAVLRRRRKEA